MENRMPSSRFLKFFDTFSAKVTQITGSPLTFILALIIVIAWAVTGPIFHFSDTWLLVINTGTTIITFLMVFVIQQSQNKDTIAVQLKLDELIASNRHASNQLIDVENLSFEELTILKKFYIELSEKAQKDRDLKKSQPIEDAQRNEEQKAESNEKTQN